MTAVNVSGEVLSGEKVTDKDKESRKRVPILGGVNYSGYCCQVTKMKK